MPAAVPARLRRLAEELEELGLHPLPDDAVQRIVLEEIDRAMRPKSHERRVLSSGVIVAPRRPSGEWAARTELEILHMPIPRRARPVALRYADGLSSWLVRRGDGDDEWLMFDRPAGSQRDLVVLAKQLDASVVQRHPSSSVRVAGRFGVLRWERLAWHHDPPIDAWIEAVSSELSPAAREVLVAAMEFAVHDLGAQGIGALLVLRDDDARVAAGETRLAPPPPLQITTAFHLAPLRHALAQVDGAAVFDSDGVLRQLGVRIVPSEVAERVVEGLRGTRHTAARRHSYDEPNATIITVSEDGPVSVMCAGEVLAQSRFEV